MKTDLIDLTVRPADESLGRLMVEFADNPTSFLAPVTAEAGPRIMSILTGIQLPKPVQASLRRASKQVKFSRQRDTQELEMVVCHCLALGGGLRERAYEIARLVCAVPFADYSIYESVRGIIESTYYKAVRLGDTDVANDLRPALEKPDEYAPLPSVTRGDGYAISLGQDIRSFPAQVDLVWKKGPPASYEAGQEAWHMHHLAAMANWGGGGRWTLPVIAERYDWHEERQLRALAGEQLVGMPPWPQAQDA